MSTLSSICKPFCLISRVKPIFLIWLLFVLLLGQIGILCSIFFHIKTFGFFNGIYISIAKNLNSGNFYTFSIALLAGSLGAINIDYLLNDDIKFKVYKVIVSALSVLFIVLMAIFYSFLFLNDNSPYGLYNWTSQITMDSSKLTFDKGQITFYFITIFLSIYVFCLGYLHLDYESFKELDDSLMNALKKNSGKVANDGKGNKV